MSSRSLDDLSPDVRKMASDLILTAEHNGMPVTVIGTLRTESEQIADVAKGVSWTMDSLHLPQPPDELARALDIAPTELLPTKGWSPASPLWLQLGEWGEALGFEWGGRWLLKVVNGKVVSHPDPSHFQKRHPTDPVLQVSDVPDVPVPEQQV